MHDYAIGTFIGCVIVIALEIIVRLFRDNKRQNFIKRARRICQGIEDHEIEILLKYQSFLEKQDDLRFGSLAIAFIMKEKFNP